MIKLTDITLFRKGKPLIESANFCLYPGQKAGLIGLNGVGKSSLFSVLLGKTLVDKGQVEIPKNWRVGHVAQEIPECDTPAIDFILEGDKPLCLLQKQLAEAELAGDGHKMAELHGELDAIDGYRARSKAAELLYGLGFKSHEYENPVNTFSGGWRVRLNLAQALMSRSDLLLLDEPTNHLDLEAILWLEQWLKNYPGTLIIIAHDSDFLDALVDTIIHMKDKVFKLYKGNYTQFLRQSAEQLTLQSKLLDKQLSEREKLQKFITRFKAKASKAKQAQSRMKTLARMEDIVIHHASSPLQFKFPPLSKCPNPLLHLEKVDVGYSVGKPIIKDIKLSILPGSRLGLLGVNGAGKSTLVKVLARQLEPLAGVCTWGDGLRIGYFAQYQLELLDRNCSPMVQFQRLNPEASPQQSRDFLGSFNFSNDLALQPIGQLSGGEKARLVLALLVWQKPHLLLLDEPTNHLDIETREALALALQEFDGALIVVSHDRALLNETVDELLLVNDQKLSVFEGDMEAYANWLTMNRALEKKKESKNLKAATDANTNANKSKNKTVSSVDLKKLEQQLEVLQKELKALELALADETMYVPENKGLLATKLVQQKELNTKLVDLEKIWFEAQENSDK